METNPYKPPSANVRRTEPPVERSVWWKIYFWFLFLTECLYAGWIIIDPEGAEAVPSDYYGLIIYVFVLLAIFGFAYSKRFLTRILWQLFFPFVLLWDLWFIFIDGDWQDIMTLGITPLIASLIIIITLMIPQYIALYCYGFREHELWHMMKH